MARRKTKAKTHRSKGVLQPGKPRLRLASDAQTASIKAAFPPGIAQPALRALYAAGFTTLEQLASISETELLAMHGIGPNAGRKLCEGLKAIGLRFRDSGRER